MVFAGPDGLTPEIGSLLRAAAALPFPVVRALIGERVAAVGGEVAELTLTDGTGRIARKYAAAPGTVYLLRPDRYVCARWRRADAARLLAALLRAAACSTDRGTAAFIE